jgi:hypothetical protein
MRTLVVALIAAALAAPASQTLAQAAPATAASPLPEIGRVRSKGFCTTVRDNVAPSLLGVMKTDELIGAGHRAFAKMADDAVRAPKALDLDRVYLRRIAGAMANNLRIVDKLLGDQQRFPRTAATHDGRFALQVKAQLQAIAAEQHKTLDFINGTVETDALGQMRSEIDTQMESSLKGTPPTPTGPSSEPTSFLGAAGLPDMAPVPVLSERSRLTSSETLGHRPYDRVTAGVEYEQAQISRSEAIASPTLIAAGYACHEDGPAPSPTP